MRYLTLLLLPALAGPAAAHETWLLPAAFRAAAKEAVRLDLTSGEAETFPTPDHAIRPDRVAAGGLRVGSKTLPLPAGEAVAKALKFAATFPTEGVGTAWVSLAPKSLTLTPAQVVEYFNEVAAPAAVRETWALRPAGEGWKETYTKHAKTFVRVGTPPAGDDSWKEPTGQGLELVPVADPFALKPGGRFPVKLMKAGKPLADAAVGLAGADGRRVFRVTDAAGRAAFRLPEAAGPVLLFAVDLRRAKAGVTWESDFAALTVTSGK